MRLISHMGENFFKKNIHRKVSFSFNTETMVTALTPESYPQSTTLIYKC